MSIVKSDCVIFLKDCLGCTYYSRHIKKIKLLNDSHVIIYLKEMHIIKNLFLLVRLKQAIELINKYGIVRIKSDIVYKNKKIF